MVEEGKLTYPFSTRELVSVVTHLEKYPDDGVITVLDTSLRLMRMIRH